MGDTQQEQFIVVQRPALLPDRQRARLTVCMQNVGDSHIVNTHNVLRNAHLLWCQRTDALE